jgi:hypothetical protein
LVGRRQQHDVGIRPDQRVDVDPLRRDGDAHHLDAGGGRNGTDLGVERVLDRHPPGAALDQHLAEQGDGLGEPVADQHVLRVRRRSPGPVEVIGQRPTQLGGAAPADVGQRLGYPSAVSCW